MEIVFFGTGPVAAKSLELLAKDFIIEAVVTKPKPTHHKASFPVIELAHKLDIPLKYATNRQELSAVIRDSHFTSKVGVLIDFGIIVAQDVIDYFPLGIVNSHFSLLPEWRGPDPITFAILSGQKETGVSLMLIVEKMDEGPLLKQGVQIIASTYTVSELTDRLIELSHDLLVRTLPDYAAGTSKPYPQDTMITPTYSRKLTKEDGAVDWTKPAAQIEREIRAFLGWPSSYTTLRGKNVKLLAAEVIAYDSNHPGLVCNIGGELHVECGQNSLKIIKLQVAGKKPVSGSDFLRAYGF